ncbi:MAG: hypothetical protein ACLP59_16000 [Bryobacteraceae bacterium]
MLLRLRPNSAAADQLACGVQQEQYRMHLESRHLAPGTINLVVRAIGPDNSLTGDVRQRTLDDAIALAVRAHRGQRDKGDQPYLLHVFRVMLSQNDETARIVAVLHDSLEDTSVTLMDLRAAGYSDEICEAVDCLTRRTDEPYGDMITRVRGNPLARCVKLADLEDNLNPNRVVSGDPGANERAEKYRAARERLLGV